ncbi:MAG: T9SS type A sorting domain-containing protein [Bacteroidota bacterium]
MKKLFSLLMLAAICSFSFGQSRMDKWQYGFYQALNFGPGGPVQGTSAIASGPSASICTPNGDLLMYTNNNILWDGNHNLVSSDLGNPVPLNMTINRTQTIIVKQPCVQDAYFVFSTVANVVLPGSALPFPTSTEFTYSEVTATPNPLSVSVLSTNQSLATPVSTEKVTAIAHKNGRDIWVLTYDISLEEYHAYLVDPNGVSQTPVISDLNATGGIPLLPSPNFWQNSRGELKISPTKHKLAMAIHYFGIQLCNFDTETGLVSNCEVCKPGNIPGSPRYNNLEFAPSEDILYYDVANNNNGDRSIGRLDLTQPSIGDICASFQYVHTLNAGSGNAGAVYSYSGLQRGPDDKIYAHFRENIPGLFDSGIGVIPNPDNLANPGYIHNLYPSNPVTNEGDALPNFMQSYFDPNYEEDLDGTLLPKIMFEVEVPPCLPCDAKVDICVTKTCSYSSYHIEVVNVNTNSSLGFQNDWQASFQDLCVGNYEIQVKDPITGVLLASEPFTVTQPNLPPTMNVTTINPNCSCSGQINVSGVGGTPPYQYFFNGMPFSGMMDNLCGGVYNIEILDDLGCTVGASVVLKKEAFQVDGIRYPFCEGDDCGIGTAFWPQNGTPPFVYTINGIAQPAGQNIFGPLCPNDVVQVRDANGCTETFVVIDHLPVGSVVNGPDVICASNLTHDYEILLPPGFYINNYITTYANSSSQNGNVITIDWTAVMPPPGNPPIHSLEISIYDTDNKEYCYIEFPVSIDPGCRLAGTEIEVQRLPLTLYPNPAERSLNIQIDEKADGPVIGQVVSLSGQTLMRWSEEQVNGSYAHKLDISSLAAGLYMLRLQIGDQLVTEKFVKR